MMWGRFGAKASSSGRRRVLLAEDEPDVRDLFAILLRDAGYEVVVAADGMEALQLWESTEEPRPGLVLTDWCMPGIDGIELARRIRADPVGTEVPIVLYTAYHAPPEAELTELQVHYRSKAARWSEIAPLINELTR